MAILRIKRTDNKRRSSTHDQTHPISRYCTWPNKPRTAIACSEDAIFRCGFQKSLEAFTKYGHCRLPRPPNPDPAPCLIFSNATFTNMENFIGHLKSEAFWIIFNMQEILFLFSRRGVLMVNYSQEGMMPDVMFSSASNRGS